MRTWLVLIPLLWVGTPLVAEGQEMVGFHGSEAFRDFRQAGYEMVDQRLSDLNGDDLRDAIVVEQSGEGLGLSAWHATAEGDFKLAFRSGPVPASSVTTFSRLPFGTGDFVFLLDVVEESPDEAEHWVKLFLAADGTLRPVFESGYRLTHSEEDAGRQPVRVVDLGGLREGFELIAAGTDRAAWPELAIRQEPKRIQVSGPGRKATWFVIGIRERIHRAKPGARRSYEEVENRYVNYLPRLDPASVTASSRLPAAGDAFQPGMATDHDLDTAWVEGKPDSGEGESLTVTFAEPRAVRMVRIVPGCADSAEGWKSHNRILRLRLQFDDGTILAISRELGADLDPRVEACEDFGLPGLGFGQQSLVFLKQPVRSRWIKVIIDSVERGEGEEDATCLAEISAHSALIDGK